MLGLRCCLKIASKNWNLYHWTLAIFEILFKSTVILSTAKGLYNTKEDPSSKERSQNNIVLQKILIMTKVQNKTNALFLFIAFCVFPLNTHAVWYTGGSILLHPIPYNTVDSNYIKLGSSKLNIIANGISINAGYKYNLTKYMAASEFDIGGFSDADGNIVYQDVKHYVSASYYMAIKQKFGFHFTPNFVGYGLVGLSENSIGDRIYSTAQYFNKKQLSFLYGGGLEYYTKRDNNIALFAEFIYFTPSNATLYSGGANASRAYSISTYGIIPQFGMRYYFN